MIGGIYRYFELRERGTSIRTEVLAGVTTFLALSYIFAVNPAILEKAGVALGRSFFATVFVSGVGTILIGLIARLPFALAPGMEMNAFVAFHLAGVMGLAPSEIFGTVFWSGCLFLGLSLSGIRQRVIDEFPDGLKVATSAAVGAFLLAISLRLAGIAGGDDGSHSALLSLASPKAAVLYAGIAGALLTRLVVPSVAILSSLIVAACTAWFFGLEGPSVTPLHLTDVVFEVPSLSVLTSPRCISPILVLLILDLYGSIAKVVGLSMHTSIQRPDGVVPRFRSALILDSGSTTVGSLLGTSNLTVFVESATGIAAGGRSGLTAIVCGLLMLSCFWAYPLFAKLPVVASAGALVVVGLGLIPGRVFRQLSTMDRVVTGCMIVLSVSTFSLDRPLLFGYTFALLQSFWAWGRVSPVLFISALALALAVFAK